ncbi:ATP synthase subunit delta [Planctomycetales bacterium 10988]|nr:ATP synthase subunit delta [Planctomycetales bacterium 10988]
MSDAQNPASVVSGSTVPEYDPRSEQLGRVYSQALVSLAEDDAEADALLDDFRAVIHEILDEHPDLEKLLSSHLVETEEKVAMLERIFAGKISDKLLRFFKVVAERERLDCIRSIYRQVRTMIDEMRGRLRVHVTTAVPLEENLENKLVEMLRQRRNLDPYLIHHVEPSIIGGIIVRIGDTVFDDSVSTHLHQLHQQMIDRSVHEIQSRRDRFSHPEGD